MAKRTSSFSVLTGQIGLCLLSESLMPHRRSELSESKDIHSSSSYYESNTEFGNCLGVCRRCHSEDDVEGRISHHDSPQGLQRDSGIRRRYADLAASSNIVPSFCDASARAAETSLHQTPSASSKHTYPAFPAHGSPRGSCVHGHGGLGHCVCRRSLSWPEGVSSGSRAALYAWSQG